MFLGTLLKTGDEMVDCPGTSVPHISEVTAGEPRFRPLFHTKKPESVKKIGKQLSLKGKIFPIA
jgi:hypothetical protein